MHFKTCRKASSSDDCERITGKPEVIGLSTGLVPVNALVVIHFWIVGYPGNCTTTPGASHGCGLYLQPVRYGCGLYLEPVR